MITPYGGAIPDKAVMDKDTFADSVNPYLNYINTDFVPQANALETNVNAKEASTVYSADIAIAAANYQGDWVSQGYSLGQSVSYNGYTYSCKLTHSTGFVPTDTTYWRPTGIAQVIDGATSKTTPVGADKFGIWDSVTGGLNGLTLDNLKATIFTSPALTGTPTINGGRAIDEDTTAYSNDTLAFIANTLPSGAILESGSNSNGSYLKIVDGTILYQHRRTDTSITVGAAVGSNFRSGERSWTLPTPCLDGTSPSAFIRGESPLASPIWPVSATTTVGGNTAIYWVWMSSTSQTITTIVSLFAIGKWK